MTGDGVIGQCHLAPRRRATYRMHASKGYSKAGGRIQSTLRPVSYTHLARKRRFAHARRPPEHHGGHTVAVYELAQHLALAQKMPP